MGGLGAGLLGFAQGAMGAADEYIKDERDHERKFSLEDYRIEKERELADYKNSLAEISSAKTYARDTAESLRKEGVVTESEKFKEEAATERSRIAADASKERGESVSKATEASLKRSWTSGAAAINSAFGEELKEANATVTDQFVLPKDPQDYLAALEEIGTPQAQSFIDLIHEYLDSVDSWSKDDLLDWREDLRAVAKKEKEAGSGLGLRVVGRRKGE